MAALRTALPLHWKKAREERREEQPRRGGPPPLAHAEPRHVRVCGAVLPVGDDFEGLSGAEVAAGVRAAGAHAAAARVVSFLPTVGA